MTRVFCGHQFTWKASVGMRAAVLTKDSFWKVGWCLSDCHLQVELCVQHACISSLCQDRLSSGDLPLLSFFLWSQPCKADSQMPSWLMLKPNSWRQERTEIRVTFSGGKKKKKVLYQEKVLSFKYDLRFLPYMVFPVKRCFPLSSTWFASFIFPSDIAKCSFMTRRDQLAVGNLKEACDSM